MDALWVADQAFKKKINGPRKKARSPEVYGAVDICAVFIGVLGVEGGRFALLPVLGSY